MRETIITIDIVLALVLAVSAPGPLHMYMSSAVAQGQTASPSATFPPQVGVPPLTYAGPEQGYPPKILGITNARPIPSKPLPALDPQREDQIRNATLADPRVRQAVGDHFALLGVFPIPVPKSKPVGVPSPTPVQQTRVVLFSYSDNVAVEALLSGLTVERVVRRPDYMLPESAEEVSAAIKLARADDRIADKVKDLPASAILGGFSSEGKSPSHRLLHASFFHSDDDEVPSFEAMVDLTAQQVLSAGPVPQR